MLIVGLSLRLTDSSGCAAEMPDLVNVCLWGLISTPYINCLDSMCRQSLSILLHPHLPPSSVSILSASHYSLSTTSCTHWSSSSFLRSSSCSWIVILNTIYVTFIYYLLFLFKNRNGASILKGLVHPNYSLPPLFLFCVLSAELLKVSCCQVSTIELNCVCLFVKAVTNDI